MMPGWGDLFKQISSKAREVTETVKERATAYVESGEFQDTLDRLREAKDSMIEKAEAAVEMTVQKVDEVRNQATEYLQSDEFQEKKDRFVENSTRIANEARQKVQETASRARDAGEAAYERAVDYYYSDEFQAKKDRVLEFKDEAISYVQEKAVSAYEKAVVYAERAYTLVGSFVTTCKGVLSSGNIVQLICSALQRIQTKAAVKLLGKGMQVALDNVDSEAHTVSLSLLSDDDEAFEMQMQSDSIDPSLKAGMTFEIPPASQLLTNTI